MGHSTGAVLSDSQVCKAVLRGTPEAQGGEVRGQVGV